MNSALPPEDGPVRMTSEEVGLSEGGRISERQRSVLRKHRLRYLAGSAGFFVLLTLLVAAVAIKVADPSFGARGPFWLGGAFAVFWLVLLRRTCPQYGRVRRDLREGHVESVTGVVSHHLSSTPGLIRFLRYRIRCGERRFSVPQDAFFRLQEGRSYHISYARHSGVFLGAAPSSAVSSVSGADVSDAEASAADDRASSLEPPLPALVQAKLDPLLEREQEVLELIAAGLSNQEIADRLYLSLPTIKMYASQLYRKLGVRRRTEAVRRARQEGLLPPP